jgi:hypothetical protein
MIKEKTDKKEIFIDSEGFNRKQAEYSKKKTIEQNIKFLVKKLLKINISSSFYKDIPANFYKAVEKAYKDSNPMNLKGEKLVSLLDMDTTELFKLNSEYKAIKNAKEPSMTEFTIYAETSQELAKYRACNDLIDACKTMEMYIKIFPVNIQHATKNAVLFDLRKNKLVANHHWIKNTMRF